MRHTLFLLLASLMLLIPAVSTDAKVYLVSVGITDYPGNDMDLTLPANDAKTIANLYAKNSKVQYSLLVNSQATKARIIKAMKKVAGTLKIDQAQYRELEAFAKFSSDMDAVTAMTIDRGRKNNQLLIQSQYSPMPVAEQVAILYCGTKGLLRKVPLEKVRDFQEDFLQIMRTKHAEDVLGELLKGNLGEEVTEIIEKVAADVAGQYAN